MIGFSSESFLLHLGLARGNEVVHGVGSDLVMLKHKTGCLDSLVN